MSTLPKLILHKHKTDAVKRFHPWVFSGAIKFTEGELGEGAIVEVYSETGEYLATGHYSPGNIAVKIFSFAPVADVNQLLGEKIQQAFAARQQLGLADGEKTTCYRLVNTEGDGLPGLIVDWYDGTAVLQFYSLGMYEKRAVLVEALQQVYGTNLKNIYSKSSSTLPKKAQVEQPDGYLLGDSTSGEVQEYGHRFRVDWETGQKTGLFLDQRENRHLLARYAEGKKILNTFCYSGGFSVYAVQAGARVVHSVDSSERAIAWTEENVALNNPEQVPHQTFAADVFDFLKHCDDDYDLIILDPPAFAKNLSARHQAMQAYRRLNRQAFSKIRPGGLVFTFSCSQVVGPEHFTGAVTAAAIDSAKPIQILQHLTQPADHPVSIYQPEGLYLKGLVLRVA